MNFRSRIKFEGLSSINWAIAIGWLIFFGILVINETKHFVFDPLIFGAGYFTFYSLLRLGDEKERNVLDLCLIVAKQNSRIVGLGIIALIFIWNDLESSNQERHFAKEVQGACTRINHEGIEQTNLLCEEIGSLMSNHLRLDH